MTKKPLNKNKKPMFGTDVAERQQRQKNLVNSNLENRFFTLTFAKNLPSRPTYSRKSGPIDTINVISYKAMKKIKLTLSIISIALITRVFSQPGMLDNSFGLDGKQTSGFSSGYDAANAVVVQLDGKVIVAGYLFSGINDDFALARFNTDGTPDISFDSDGKQTVAFGSDDDIAFSAALQSDGKIIIAGYSFNGTNLDFALARFNSNGSIDNTFGIGGKVTTDFSTSADRIYSIAIQADGKIVATGLSGNDFALIRYNPNGAIDNGFGLSGKITTDFGSNYDVSRAVAIQPDGKIVVAGRTFNGSNYDFALARYSTDGILDNTFDMDGKLVTSVGMSSDNANSITIQTDGKIIAAGYSNDGVTGDFALVRYNMDGTLDSSFSGDGKQTTPFFGTGDDEAYSLTLQPDGKIILAGRSSNDFALARYNPDGTLDISFDTDGKLSTTFGTGTDVAYSVAVKPDGKIIVAGYSYNGSDNDFALAQYNPEGTMDIDFNSSGKLVSNFGMSEDAINSVALQPDGKIVAIGYSHNGMNYYFALTRYNTDGTLDNSFGIGGKLTTAFGSTRNDVAVAGMVQPDGKIIAIGETRYGDKIEFAIARYNVDGILDNSFGTNGKTTTYFGTYPGAIATSGALQADGKIIVAGYDYNATNDADFALARFNPNGSLDFSFNTDGKLTTAIGTGNDFPQSIVIQPDGKIIVAGYSYSSNNADFSLVRYSANGSLDNSFSGDGKLTTAIGNSADVAQSVTLQPDGKVVVAGYTWNGANNDFAVIRYNSDGTLDNSFDSDGKLTTAVGAGSDNAESIILQPDNKILVGGRSSGHFGIVRYNSDGTLDNSFDSDGKLTTNFGFGGSGISSIVLQPDGKIVAAGYALYGTDRNFGLARYLSGLVGIDESSNFFNSATIYPNPIRSNGILEYTLNHREKISMQLFDLQGRLVMTIIENIQMEAGKHQQLIILPEELSPGSYVIVFSSSYAQVGIQIIRQF